MAIRRVRRDAEGIGALKLLSALDMPASAGKAADGADSVEAFAQRLARSVRSSLESSSRLHGLRVEAMFRAVLVALGGFRLLVEEDEGQVYFDDSDGPIKQPDYRVVDADGHQLLIEVKSVAPRAKCLSHSMRASEVDGLRRYGALTGAPVAVAHYWSAANIWTLVGLDRLKRSGDTYRLDLTQALKVNEMARFGDLSIGTVPPIALRLTVQEVAERTEPSTATIRIDDVQLLVAGQPILDEVEQRIAFLLFRYGGWPISQPAQLDAEGRLRSFDLEAAPPAEAQELVERQGMAMVGALSSMFSALFNEMTIDDEGGVQLLDHHPEPGELGSLIPPDYWEKPNRQLLLWALRQQLAD
jgi:hypothetical protein